MAIRSAIGGQFGAAPEVTYGTYVAPTKFPDTFAANIKDGSTYAYPAGIAAGRLQPLASRSVQVGEGGTAHVEMPIWSKQLGIFLQSLMGTSVTPVIIGAGPGYTQTHTLADNYGKSLTLQTGLPEISTGTVRSQTLLGAKPTSATFSCEAGGIGMSTWDFIGREFDATQTLATQASVTAVPFSWMGTTSELAIGSTVGGAAHVEGVKKVSVTVNRNYGRTDAYAGNLGRISEPVINQQDENVISGSLDIDYVTKADFIDRFHGHTQFSLVWTLMAGTFTGGVETFKITLPACYLTGETPDMSGSDVVQGSVPFVSEYDGTTYGSIVYISQEAAI